MRSRMDRYSNNTNVDLSNSRSKKNKELYNSIGSNTRYTTFTNVRDANKIELGRNVDNVNTRENYQRVKEFYGYSKEPKMKQELEEFDHWYQDKDNKVYDINSVIDEAKKNREDSSREALKKLDNDEYNILSDMNKEELKKYLEERKNSTKPDKEELKELINTITSKTLCGELDQKTSIDLLSDLMATQVQDKVDMDEIRQREEKNKCDETMHLDNSVNLALEAQKLEEKIERNRKEGKSSKIFGDMDDDFYTRSMDLSDKDFDMDDDLAIEMKKGVPVFVKIILVFILLLLVGVLVFFIIKSF